MSLRQKRSLLALFLFVGGIIAAGLTTNQEFKLNPQEKQKPTQTVLSASEKMQATGSAALVTKVVDGDTIEVRINNKQEKIRIIGINTPESVDPRRGVQCFGIDASNRAKEKLTGQTVVLQKDPSQSERDKYGRLLRFIWMNNGKTDFGASMIAEGYAYEYTYGTPHMHQERYQQLQKEAEQEKRGLWSEQACGGKTNDTTSEPSTDKKHCSDFTSRQDAQKYFESHGGITSAEVKGMDGNGDGEACETLP